MIKTKWIATAALLAAGFSGAANAVPMTWTNTVDFVPDRLVVEWNPVVWTHTVTNFNTATDTVSSYSLLLNLYDDADRSQEIALFSQPGSLLNAIFFDVAGPESAGWTYSGRAQLDASGSLTVAISSLLGDFYLGSSTLTVRGDRDVRNVPEPTTLALLGTALLGFGLVRRKRQQI